MISTLVHFRTITQVAELVGSRQPSPVDLTTARLEAAGTPALSVRCGMTSDGLPLRLQLAGRTLAEPLLCRIGYAYEQATDWHSRHPPEPHPETHG